MDILNKLAKNFKKHVQNERPREPKVTSLLKFCKRHRRPDGDLHDLVRRHGLDEPLIKMFQTYFKHGQTKKCCYWHFGAPNTGKTKMMELLKEIFYCQTLKYAKGGWPISEQGKYATQIVLLDESNEFLLFTKENISNMKSFFEGNGFQF